MIIQRFISISGDAMVLFGSFMFSCIPAKNKPLNKAIEKRTNQNNNNKQIHMPKCEKWKEMEREREREREE